MDNWLFFIGLTTFNALVCICLPRIITLNWSAIFNQKLSNTEA